METPVNTNVKLHKLPETDSQSCWKAEMAESFTRVEDLLDYLELPTDSLANYYEPARRFPFRVTRAYASRMKKGELNDPLLLQALPTIDELFDRLGYTADPVGDLQAIALPGLLHKYHGRVLLIVTGACAINCRYCFRREFPYSDGQLTHSRQAEALAYIAQDDSIAEVILSGGDPLMLDDNRLALLYDGIADIPHVRRVRIHTRLPVVLPSRITSGLVKAVTSTRLNTVVTIHANHANELDAEVGLALQRLRNVGLTLLNQSVLLKGVNDTVEALTTLSEILFEQGVLPYYLHLLDKANGTGHFDVNNPAASALHDDLQRLLPGYLVPRLVRETAGAPYKLNILKEKYLP